MKPVTMYATGLCPYCVMAEKLLRSRGVTELNKIRVDSDAAQLQTMMKISGRRTVPQIFIGDFHVGGYDDLSALDREGSLESLLHD
ncbi:glutaredoxin 3 [Candidatus Methylospira mobilis]|uniref:Glutaredoxin n=1 Tax=Candidatus Methylospira mobilis TaxID=1808979 RepID=A0A5Q0BCK6_9GAMM|nr:glutaredoxin 3 [Candidatus Methylospira mobilis]QFY41595.1 glutaredoxin 3 [Candidatus Methylospira mobilis]WNV05161.1 glutaredoxin 3 [Candidatus Methylospira mobilis]